MTAIFVDVEADLLDRHRITVDEFIQMDEAGVFDPDARLELIDGVIVEMSPIKPPHAHAVSMLAMVFSRDLAGRAYIRSQSPAECDEYSLPQPDVVLAELPADRYRTRHPRADETYLAVEVGDSTVRSDRRVKIPLFARSGIPEAWLLDIPARRLEVYSQPDDGRYLAMISHSEDEVVSPKAFPDVEVTIGELL